MINVHHLPESYQFQERSFADKLVQFFAYRHVPDPGIIENKLANADFLNMIRILTWKK